MLVASRCDWPRDGRDDTDTSDTLDYSKTLYLPQTDFPMRPACPRTEPLLVKRWQEMDLYRRLRDTRRRPSPLRRSMTAALRQRQHPYRPCR